MTTEIEALLYSATGPIHVHEAMADPMCEAQTEDSVRHVAQKMKQAGCGFVPITDQGHLAGVITARDIAVYFADLGADQLGAMRAWEIMSKPVIAVYADDSLDHARQIMAEHQVWRLPVIDHGQLVGVISRRDLA